MLNFDNYQVTENEQNNTKNRKRLHFVTMNVKANQAYLEKRTKSIKYPIHI